MKLFCLIALIHAVGGDLTSHCLIDLDDGGLFILYRSPKISLSSYQAQNYFASTVSTRCTLHIWDDTWLPNSFRMPPGF